MMYDLVASVSLPWQGASSSHSGIGAHSNASVVPPEVCSPSDDSRAQNVVDEFFQPVKPTLGQIVRQELSEGRKKRVLVALEEAGVFTFGGLVKDKVLFCSTCYHLLVEASEVTWLEETQPPENLMVKKGQYIGPTIRRC